MIVKMSLFNFCFLTCLISGCLASLEDEFHTNSWVIEVPSGSKHAREIAAKHNFLFRGEVPGLPGFFELEHEPSPKRSSEPHLEAHEKLTLEPKVRYVAQQVAKVRRKRGYVYSPPQDPMYPSQWFLHNPGGGITYKGFDLNVEPAWKMGFTGKNVVVTILDDGIERDHPDLNRNYDPQASYDVNGKDSDPMPRYDYTNENNHGTRCAGEVAAVNNKLCSTGVAYDCKIGGVRMLDGSVTDLVEATSLGFRQDHIDVYSSSWGPDDDGKTLDGPGVLAQKAFLQGISTGRNGKGSIFVWASGNGGTAHDSCSCDGYVISPYTIGIGAATEEGKKPWYVEECPAQMAVTPSSGSFKHRKIITPDLRHKCTTSHTGTSAAAPLAAAVIALGLQANPSLTWRDVQHIIVITSKKEHLTSNWQTNAAGFHFSHQFGFGMMDAAAIVNRAIDWVSVPERINCSVAPKLLNSGGTLHLTVDSGCRVTYAEHVVVNLSISLHHGRRGDIHISLISPHGTRSELLPKRSRDSQTKSIINWPFMTVASWGEDPKGKWSLQVVADGGSKAEITSVQLVVFGTEGTPIGVQRITRQCHKSCKGKCSGPQATACDDCTQYRVYESRECVESCPPATFSSESVCWPCPNGCSMCDRDRCTECFSGLSLLTNGSCSCSQEQYKTVDNNKVTCVSCDEVCLSCNGSGPGNCLACKPSFSSVSGTCVRTDLISSYELSSHLLSASSVVLESTQSSSASSLPSLVSSPIPSLTSADHVKESTSTTSTEDVTTSTEDATASTEDTSAISITSSVLLTSESAGGGHPVDLSPEGSPLAMGAVVVLLGCVIIGATVGVVIVIIFKVGRTKYRRYKPIKEEQGYWDSDEELIYKQ